MIHDIDGSGGPNQLGDGLMRMTSAPSQSDRGLRRFVRRSSSVQNAGGVQSGMPVVLNCLR